MNVLMRKPSRVQRPTSSSVCCNVRGVGGYENTGVEWPGSQYAVGSPSVMTTICRVPPLWRDNSLRACIKPSCKLVPYSHSLQRKAVSCCGWICRAYSENVTRYRLSRGNWL